MHGVDINKLLDIAHINWFLKKEITWLSKNNIGILDAQIFIIGVTLFLLFVFYKALVPSEKKANPFALDVLYLLVKFFCLLVCLFFLPFGMQEYRAKNYVEYLSMVQQNIIKTGQSLSVNEKRVLNFCLKDSSNNQKLEFNRNAHTSGERFDRCILRYAFIEYSHSQKSEHNNFNQQESQRIANNIRETLGHFPEDEVNEVAQCSKETKQVIKSKVDTILNEETSNDVVNNLPSKK